MGDAQLTLLTTLARYIAVGVIYPILFVSLGDRDGSSLTFRSDTPINSSTGVDFKFIVGTQTATTLYFYPPSASCKCFFGEYMVPDFSTVNAEHSYVSLCPLPTDAGNEWVLSSGMGMSDGLGS